MSRGVNMWRSVQRMVCLFVPVVRLKERRSNVKERWEHQICVDRSLCRVFYVVDLRIPWALIIVVNVLAV